MNDEIETLREGQIDAYQFRQLIKSTKAQRDKWLKIVTEQGWGTQNLHDAEMRLLFLKQIEVGFFHYPTEKS